MLQPTYFKRHNLNFEGRPSSFPVSAARRVAVCRQVHDIHSDCDYSNMLATREITWTFLPVLEIHILSSAKGGCYCVHSMIGALLFWSYIVTTIVKHPKWQTSYMVSGHISQRPQCTRVTPCWLDPCFCASFFIFSWSVFLQKIVRISKDVFKQKHGGNSRWQTV